MRVAKAPSPTPCTAAACTRDDGTDAIERNPNKQRRPRREPIEDSEHPDGQANGERHEGNPARDQQARLQRLRDATPEVEGGTEADEPSGS